jgi:hypothetical protein
LAGLKTTGDTFDASSDENDVIGCFGDTIFSDLQNKKFN